MTGREMNCEKDLERIVKMLYKYGGLNHEYDKILKKDKNSPRLTQIEKKAMGLLGEAKLLADHVKAQLRTNSPYYTGHYSAGKPIKEILERECNRVDSYFRERKKRRKTIIKEARRAVARSIKEKERMGLNRWKKIKAAKKQIISRRP